ncbi:MULTISPECIES: hypothetical protein [Streptomyces]|uniref:Uncharacterized protein n=1 Tax=Streptomyces koelreuteriae TaxID=2838015 RepID=A0ABX8FT13_9ACTN|nr:MULTISPECIES: hypothetical protein [Streptomyces]QWB24204.1 hypothetical protein KJK29_17255 [Streptomyces koelreuteriae]UUA07199.1 hypothetical protein NNW98_17345 [Streptomyces koelreuteriae]UUA14828.1 hypothetical protein NNW99_17340 [Streptomyces sp. CRCS-T-1]
MTTTTRGVDQGALTATTFTTVFVLVMDAGEYDLLNGVVGAVCALILLAYYRPLPAQTPFDAKTGALAFGAVAGLQVASGVSWMIQPAVNWAVDQGLLELSKTCRDRSQCLGDKADVPVVIAWAAAAVWLGYQHYRRFPHVPPSA